MSEAGSALKRSIEEKKLAEMEAAKKAKAKAKSKKGKTADEDGAGETEAQVKLGLATDEDFDLDQPEGFTKALQAKVPRPFIFGPVEFDGLDESNEEKPFDAEAARDKVIAVLGRSLQLPNNLCKHGYKVKIKSRTLKRRTTILKHARFLRNLEVMPIVPTEPEPLADGEGDGDDD